jgi:hypothetical protein
MLAAAVLASAGMTRLSRYNDDAFDDEELYEEEYYGYDSVTIPEPIGARAKLPPPHPGSKNIAAALSDADIYDINSGISYYTETGISEFDSASPDFYKLLTFGIDHIIINFRTSRVEYAELPDERFVLYAKVKKEDVLESVKAYFGISVLDIADYTDGKYFGENRYFFRDGYFYKAAFADYSLRWSQVTELYENEDGTYTAYFENYAGTSWPTNLYDRRRYWDLPEYTDDYGDYTYEKCGMSFAVFEDYNYDGYETYKLVKLVTAR